MEDNMIDENEKKLSNNDSNVEEKLSNNDSNVEKKLVKNIIFVAISNILTLISGVLVGLVLPKIMTKADYGFYKTFTLYLGYICLLHFGFIDGIYLIFAGKQYNELNRERFRAYSKFLFIFQLIISLVVMVIAIPFFRYDLGIIFFCLGINILLNSLTYYFQFISQITGRFKELSFRNIIKALLTSLSIIILTILFYCHIISFVNYFVYILIFTCISLFLTVWYIITYRELVFGKSSSIKSEKNEILHFFKVGFPLLIANFVSSFILSIDRQFVSVLFDIEIYASYAFAYNMLSLITTVISAISVVLYPTIKIFNDNQLKNNYNRLNATIAIVVSFCVCSYYPLKFIIDYFLPNYVDSLPIFRIILPGLVVSSCISMIMFNYYKALNKQTRYFVISLIVLGLSFGANMFAYYIYKTPIAISIASVIVMGIWYFIVEFTIVRRYKINPLKNILYIISILSSFYILTYFVDNVFIGFGVYFVVFVVITLLFHFKLIKSKFRFDK